jgi:8-oxo-dGTP pyrophosphatase MutT (NUDIX family)
MKKNNNIVNNNKYCNNCGKYGHSHHECVLPIISIGIILYRIKNKLVEYLMIRRKETFGYCDYVKNRAKQFNNKAFLKNVIDEMTIDEKKFIRNKYNDELTNELIDQSSTSWTEPEWGFPKGRRNCGEKDLECGSREFQEETGFDLKDIKLIENLNAYEELFIGSNLKSYKQKYYLAYTNYHNDDVLDKFQKSEVSKMCWFTIDECNDNIRIYNCEKRNLINQVHETIVNYESKIVY